MNIVLIATVLLLSIYPLSYGKYNWGKKQYFQAVGMVMIVFAMWILSAYALFWL